MNILPLLFDGITKKYGTRIIVEDISFTIGSGEFVSIVGNSGTGKSTLIKLILGIEKPNEGRVMSTGVLGKIQKDIHTFTSIEMQQYRRSIGVVFQDCKLLPSHTVFENIAFTLYACGYNNKAIIEDTKAALAKVGIEHLQDAYPETLSGGEAQRVALARAIVHKPKLVLADEPTGHLDAESAAQVLKNLLTINLDGTAVILFTHNHPLTQLTGQRILLLRNGALQEP